MENKKKRSLFFSIENITAYVMLGLLALLPVIEVIAQKVFNRPGIFASSSYIQHLVLLLAFVCGMITTREGKHLSLSAGIDLIKEPYKSWIRSFTSFLSISISFILTLCCLSFALNSVDVNDKIGIFPSHFLLIIIPIAMLFVTIHFIRFTPDVKNKKLIILLAFLFGLLIGINPLVNSMRFVLERVAGYDSSIMNSFETIAASLEQFTLSVVPRLAGVFIILLIISTFLGTPIFILFGGLATILFLKAGEMPETVPNAAYSLLTNSIYPAIPLFTLAGFILSESKAGERLVKLFSTFFGWLPGSTAVITIIVCAFFTTFTGASGVTILALGGLLSFMLVKKGYDKKFSIGLLTASGSIGLLFPPSLPIIMYGVIAHINIKKIFVGGILPGLVMVIIVIIMGVRHAVKNNVKRIPFKPKEIGPAFISALGEVLIPFIIIIGYFKGITTLTETSAVTVIYLIILEVFIHRDIKFTDLPKVLYKCIPLIGGILIILAIASGFKDYLVFQEVPMKLVEWMQAHIHSKYVFLILLNVVLLITGCLIDIYSAIIVIVPLIIPLGAAYGIDPVHLGIIFLANLELGYLTPPVGINLFLASYRFEEPLVKIYKYVIPFLLLLLVSVLLITYVPWITTWLVDKLQFLWAVG